MSGTEISVWDRRHEMLRQHDNTQGEQCLLPVTDLRAWRAKSTQRRGTILAARREDECARRELRKCTALLRTDAAIDTAAGLCAGAESADLDHFGDEMVDTTTALMYCTCAPLPKMHRQGYGGTKALVQQFSRNSEDRYPAVV